MKEFNLRRHYDTRHREKYQHVTDMKERQELAQDFKKSLRSQQAMFTKAKTQSDAAVKASFIVAVDIAKTARPFTEGDFVKDV